MKSIIIATVIVVALSILTFACLPVSWYDLSLQVGSLWNAKAMVTVWVLSPILISLVAWIEVHYLQTKVTTLGSQLDEAGKQVITRDGTISSLRNQLREMGRR